MVSERLGVREGAIAADGESERATPASRGLQAPQIVAIVLILLVAAATVAAWPLLGVVWGPVPRFLAIYATLLAASEVLAAVLLTLRATALRSRSAAVLAAAYCFSAPLTLCNLITLPGLLAGPGMFDHQTPPWAWMIWHFGWALAIVAFAVLPDRVEPNPARIPLTALGASLVCVVACANASILFPPLLFGADDHYGGTLMTTCTLILLPLAFALFALLRRGAKSLDAWVLVVVTTMVLDVLLTMLTGRRFSLGSYFSRTLGAVNAAIILAGIALDYGLLARRGLRVDALSTALVGVERDLEAAASLQRALLPEILPPVDGLVLSAHYRPASDPSQIGGDWWDVFYLSESRVALSVGDVAGHGLPAAAAMIRLRQTFRIAAIAEDGDPAKVLQMVNRVALLSESALMATAVFATIDLHSARLDYGLAGHPRPVLVREDGAVLELEGHGLPITVARDGKYTKHAIALRRGDLLALYTDGLVEARRQLAADTTLLKKVLMEKPPSAEAVAHAVLAGAQRDDVALLLARVVDLAAAS
jgi:hypothetical protein